MKKILIIILGFIIIILGLSFFRKNDEVVNKNFINDKKSNMAFLVCDLAGENCIENNSVPIGSYSIDENKTYCEGGGKVSNYDSALGTIKYIIKGNDECKIYFKETQKSLSETVLALERSEDYTSSQDGSIYRVVNQNGVRYEGKDPDNYVWYNCTDDNDTSTCERWRIIGVFDGTDVGLDPSKKYTKIARSTPLETEMAWDCDDANSDGDCISIYDSLESENDWVNSTLNQYLNGEYLSSLSTTAQEMIAEHNGKYSLWHLRGTDSDTHKTLYAAGWYEIERNTGTAGYRNGIEGDADAAKEAAIGLMYLSDYGYAAYGSSCNNENTETVYNYGGSCGAVDWLLYSPGMQWFISPIAGYAGGAFIMLGKSGGYVSSHGASFNHSARPVLYLEANVGIEPGDGSAENPYKLK